MAPIWCTRMESNHRRARLQRAALPLSYLCEMLLLNVARNGAAGGKSNPSSPRWQRGALPLSYGREFGGRNLGGKNLVGKNLVGRDGFEPPQNERRFYRALGSPVPSLPDIGCRGGSRIRLEQLMRLPGSRNALREIGGGSTCRSLRLYAPRPIRTEISGGTDWHSVAEGRGL